MMLQFFIWFRGSRDNNKNPDSPVRQNVPEGVEGFGSSLRRGKVLFLCPRDNGRCPTVTDSAGRVHWGFGQAPSSRRSFCGVTLCGPGLEPDDPMLQLLVLKSWICFCFLLFQSLSHLCRFVILLWNCQLQSNFPFIAESPTWLI